MPYLLKILLISIFALTSISACKEKPNAKKMNGLSPHVVILIADDLGLSWAPCYAQKSSMKYLKSKCSKAMVFERAYTHPYCTASRATMMTSRHTFRHGVGNVALAATKLALSEVTIPEYLKANGADNYRFTAFGKWHLADDQNGSTANPNLQGFDHYEGTPRQHHTYRYYDYEWVVNGKLMGREATYKTSKIANSIISDFQAHAKDGPQLYWTGFVNPHLPYHTPPKHLHSNKDLPEDFIWKPIWKTKPKANEFAVNKRNEILDPYFDAMIESLDTEIRRIVETLSSQSDRPIVFIFLGDNGTAAEVYPGDRSIGYRAKARLYDGGTRVPLMIWSNDNAAYPIQQGRNDVLVHLVDLLPTLAEITGATNTYTPANSPELHTRTSMPIDGHSFFPLLTNTVNSKFHARDFVYLERGNIKKLPFAYGAVNTNGLKLILREKDRFMKRKGMALIEIYDTTQDPAETRNLVLAPCKVKSQDIQALYGFIKNKIESEPNNKTNFNKTDYDVKIAQFGQACKT